MIFEFLQGTIEREREVCEHSHCVPGMFILKGDLARRVTVATAMVAAHASVRLE